MLLSIQGCCKSASNLFQDVRTVWNKSFDYQCYREIFDKALEEYCKSNISSPAITFAYPEVSSLPNKESYTLCTESYTLGELQKNPRRFRLTFDNVECFIDLNDKKQSFELSLSNRIIIIFKMIFNKDYREHVSNALNFVNKCVRMHETHEIGLSNNMNPEWSQAARRHYTCSINELDQRFPIKTVKPKT